MARFEQIRDRLPVLYRPEEGDDGLLSQTLQAVAEELEELNREASDALQSHWFGYADSALYSPFFIRSRELAGLPFPAYGDPVLDEFPYVHDLARLAALLALPPWLEPPLLRETVEEYRKRIVRIVALYRDGLGTPVALRRMIEAQLPPESEGQPEERDRAFFVEEFAPLVKRSRQITTPGEPLDMVGPLMRWTLENDGLAPVVPTLYVQGVEPLEGKVAATRDPLVELYSGEGLPPLGIAFQDTLAPDTTLRLRPAYASWIGREDGLRSARSEPTETVPADPTAPGPWQPVDGAPGTTVVALHQSHDRSLWAATNGNAAGELWRFDGREWAAAVEDLPLLHCLTEDDRDLFVGTDEGLFRVPLYPEEAGLFEATAVSGLEDQTVHAILRAEGSWWLGTSGGISLLEDDGEVRPFALREDRGTNVELYAAHQGAGGTLYFGTELGLFRYEPASDLWHYYAGVDAEQDAEAGAEQDWKEFVPDDGESGELPGEVGLPAVRAVRRGPDASLWIGTENGIARYVARPGGQIAYTTVLEAFPDLTEGRVFAIEEDARGLVWFGTDRGLLRYDGRDLSQARPDGWKQLGAAECLYDGDEPEPRGSWRFAHSTSQWERLGDPRQGGLRTTDEDAVLAVSWTDQVAADLGRWDGEVFVPDGGVDKEKLLMRCKPRENTVRDGGMPAVPRMPIGTSEWRYLSLEPEALEEPEEKPSWTIEGRLLPPPDLPAPLPGRYDLPAPPPSGIFDEAVFAYEPAARVWFEWKARRPLTVAARIQRKSTDESIDPAILDRVWQGIQQVRPAGVRAVLAVEEEIVRGGNDG
jgi:hypothetical protein